MTGVVPVISLKNLQKYLFEKPATADISSKVMSLSKFSRMYFSTVFSLTTFFSSCTDEGGRCLMKWTLASEEVHNLYDEKWRRACADVYEYYKGGMYE